MGPLTGLRQLLGRPIQQKFRTAVPNHRGDRLLLSLIGAIASRPGLAEAVYGEGEVFPIKGALFLEGVRLDPSAYEGVGQVWKEDRGQFHYNPDAGLRGDAPVPHALNLLHGLFLPLYLGARSPFTLKRGRGTLYLYLEELRLFSVEFEQRPGYYTRTTSTGVPMANIGLHRLQRQLLIEYNAYCKYFSDGAPCLFCGIIGEKPLYHGHYQGFFIASPQEIAEVAQAAYEDEACSEMQITGGVLPDRKEVPYILEVGRAVRARLGMATIPNGQAALVPPERGQMEELKEAG